MLAAVLAVMATGEKECRQHKIQEGWEETAHEKKSDFFERIKGGIEWMRKVLSEGEIPGELEEVDIAILEEPITLKSKWFSGYNCEVPSNESTEGKLFDRISHGGFYKSYFRQEGNSFELMIQENNLKYRIPEKASQECWDNDIVFSWTLLTGEWDEEGNVINMRRQLMGDTPHVDPGRSGKMTVTTFGPAVPLDTEEARKLGLFMQFLRDEYMPKKEARKTHKRQKEEGHIEDATEEEVKAFVKEVRHTQRREYLVGSKKPNARESWINDEALAMGFLRLAQITGIPATEMARRVRKSQIGTEFWGYPQSHRSGTVYLSGGRHIMETSCDTSTLMHEWIHLLSQKEAWANSDTRATVYEEGTTTILQHMAFGTELHNYERETILCAALGPEFYLMRMQNPREFHKTIRIPRNGGLHNKHFSKFVEKFAEQWNIKDSEDKEKLYDIFEVRERDWENDYKTIQGRKVRELKALLIKNGTEWGHFLEAIDPSEGEFIEAWLEHS